MTDRKNEEDRARSGTSDDILGISHGGGRDQYGGSFGPGQSGAGAYPNPHTGRGGCEGGNRVTGARGDAKNTGGQTNQAYYGGGQLGDRNYSDHSHSGGSTASGPEQGSRTYQDHASQGGDGGDPAHFDAANGPGSRYEQGALGDHAGFGADHPGQEAQGREHGGPHIEPDPEPGRRS